MKIYNILLFITMFALVSCQSELEDYAESPNDILTVSPPLLLTGIEVATFGQYSGELARKAAIFSQQCAGTQEGSQYLRLANYDIQDNSVNNEWNSLYSDAMNECYTLINDFGAANPHYRGIAKVLMAFNLSVVTDWWGDVPYSEAFQGLTGQYAASFDSQQSIYGNLQSLLDEAIGDFGQPASSNSFIPGADDLSFGGDIDKWRKAAYMLKARFANRLSEVDANMAGQALSFIDAAGLDGNDDDLLAIFPFDLPTAQNQWAGFTQQRGNYIKMGEFLIEQMKSTNDPRLPFFATQDADGGYSGNAKTDVTTTTTSNPGPAIATNTSPIGLVTYVEVKFIEAEAALRAGDNTRAAMAFEEAIRASLEKFVEEVDESFVSNAIADVSLENIIMNKYVSLFSSMEPYNDFRRLGLPALEPNPNAVVSAIPRRLPTPQDERLYNTAATPESDILVPVWWAQ